jgi:hypothetical protein
MDCRIGTEYGVRGRELRWVSPASDRWRAFLLDRREGPASLPGGLKQPREELRVVACARHPTNRSSASVATPLTATSAASSLARR